MIQRIVDEGEWFHSQEVTHALGFLEVGDAIWKVVIKRTKGEGTKTYLQILHKVYPCHLDANRRRLKRIDR